MAKGREPKWNSKGGGLQKHRKSGVSHNHRVTIEMNREAQESMEKQEALKRSQKSPNSSIKDLFKGYD